MVEHVRFHFVVREFVTAFGQQLRIAGSLPELGAWDAQSAPVMTWLEGHRWKLDVVLPKTTFQFKVIMVHGEKVRWEQGLNRVVEASCGSPYAPTSPLLPGGCSGAPRSDDFVIQVHCHFDQTATTQLALMVPKDLVQDAFEVARSALHVLIARSRQLQAQLDAQHAAPSPTHERELVAMREAIAGHSSSVASLSDLMEAVDDEEHVAVPVVGRAVDLPRGASLQVLTEVLATQAAAGFRAYHDVSPPRSVGAAPRSSFAGVGSSCGSAVVPPPPPRSLPGSSPAVSRPSPVTVFDAAGVLSAAPLRQHRGGQGGRRSTASRLAAEELQDIVARLDAFLQRHPAPHSRDRGDGVVDAALRAEVTQLVTLMAEAEGAWVRATAAAAAAPDGGVDGGLAPVLPLESFRQRFAVGFQDELSKAATVHAYARDQLQRCLAAGTAGTLSLDVPSPGVAIPPPRGGGDSAWWAHPAANGTISGRPSFGRDSDVAVGAPPASTSHSGSPPSLAACIAIAAAQRGEGCGRPLPRVPHDDFTRMPASAPGAAAGAGVRPGGVAARWPIPGGRRTVAGTASPGRVLPSIGGSGTSPPVVVPVLVDAVSALPAVLAPRPLSHAVSVRSSQRSSTDDARSSSLGEPSTSSGADAVAPSECAATRASNADGGAASASTSATPHVPRSMPVSPPQRSRAGGALLKPGGGGGGGGGGGATATAALRPSPQRDAAALMAELLLMPRANLIGVGGGGAASPVFGRSSSSTHGRPRRHSADSASYRLSATVARASGDGGAPGAAGSATADGAASSSMDGGSSARAPDADLVMLGSLDTPGHGGRLGRSSVPSCASYTQMSMGPSSVADTASQALSPDDFGEGADVLALANIRGLIQQRQQQQQQRNGIHLFQKLRDFLFRMGDHHHGTSGESGQSDLCRPGHSRSSSHM